MIVVGDRVERDGVVPSMRGTVVEAKDYSAFVTVAPDDAEVAAVGLRKGGWGVRNDDHEGRLTYWIHRDRLRALGVVELLAELA